MRYAGRQLGAFALLALLVRAVVPAGYMIASAETPDGRYMVVRLCDSHPGFTQVIDLETGKQVDPTKTTGNTHKPPTDKSRTPCVFASAQHLAAPVSSTTAVVSSISWHPITFQAATAAPGRGIAAPPPPSTGPPSPV